MLQSSPAYFSSSIDGTACGVESTCKIAFRQRARESVATSVSSLLGWFLSPLCAFPPRYFLIWWRKFSFLAHFGCKEEEDRNLSETIRKGVQEILRHSTVQIPQYGYIPIVLSQRIVDAVHDELSREDLKGRNCSSVLMGNSGMPEPRLRSLELIYSDNSGIATKQWIVGILNAWNNWWT